MKKKLLGTKVFLEYLLIIISSGLLSIGCSQDDVADSETNDTVDFTEVQFETLENRRQTRSAEGNGIDTIPEKKGYVIYYDDIKTSKSAQCAFAAIDVSLRALGGLSSQAQILEIHSSVGDVAYGFSKVSASIINT